MQDATALAGLIGRGDLQAVEVMEAALAAAAAQEGLGALCRIDASLGRRSAAALDQRAGSARGPLLGVPFLGKDLGSSAKGLQPMAGLSPPGGVTPGPPHDSDLFNAFHTLGLVSFGLTTVPEFGLALSSEPRVGPVARNPWDPTRTPGGSSGGAAAAVASGIVALAHATDAAGSTRIPAACCGLVGLKTTRGATPMGPDFPNLLFGIASELVVARSVRDVATCFDGCIGYPGNPWPTPMFPAASQPQTVGLVFTDRVGPDQNDAVRRAGDILQSEGIAVVEVAAPDEEGQASLRVARSLFAAALSHGVSEAPIPEERLSPLVRAILLEARGMTVADLFGAHQALAEITYRASSYFNRVDCLILPVLNDAPPKIGHFPADEGEPCSRYEMMEAMAPNAAWANVSGCPAIALPMGLDKRGLPLSVQVMASMGGDRSLLALAALIEAAQSPLPFPYPIAGMA